MTRKIVRSMLRVLKKGKNLFRVTDMDNLSKGVYFITVASANGALIAKSSLLKQ